MDKIKIEKIKKLAGDGFAVKEIARALQVDPKTVRTYLKEKKENVGTDGSNKGDIKSPKREKSDKDEAGDNSGSKGSESNDKEIGSNKEKLEFTGGLKDMADKETGGGTVNLCGNCNAEVKGTPKYCPSCGAEFE